MDDQLSAIADNISDFENVVVAYEPVWAIGTGKVSAVCPCQRRLRGRAGRVNFSCRLPRQSRHRRCTRISESGSQSALANRTLKPCASSMVRACAQLVQRSLTLLRVMPVLPVGGSVSEKTCCDLASKKDLDGFLVGGASLKGNTFAQICNAKSAVPA